MGNKKGERKMKNKTIRTKVLMTASAFAFAMLFGGCSGGEYTPSSSILNSVETSASETTTAETLRSL